MNQRASLNLVIWCMKVEISLRKKDKNITFASLLGCVVFVVIVVIFSSLAVKVLRNEFVKEEVVGAAHNKS